MVCPFRLIVVEGTLEVAAAARILGVLGLDEGAPPAMSKGGRHKFWSDIRRYNEAAQYAPVLALADLEMEACVTALFQQHLPHGRNPQLVLRLAVRMLESWLLAHHDALAAFLKISAAKVPVEPDQEVHAKRTIVNLARKSKSRLLRMDLVPKQGTSGLVGPNYTARMGEFIREHWQPLVAQTRSPSLRRALQAIEQIGH